MSISPQTDGPPPAPTDDPPADVWRPPSWKVRLIALGVVGLAVAVLGLTGGLDRVPPPDPATIPTVPVSQSIDNGPFRATVQTAAATDDLGETFRPEHDGDILLVVAVKLELAETQPDSLSSTQLYKAVRLRPFDGLLDIMPRYTILTRDASNLQFISPGLPEQVAYIFEVDAATPVPRQVTVVISGYDAHLDWFTRKLTWSDVTPKALVTVNVSNKVGTT